MCPPEMGRTLMCVKAATMKLMLAAALAGLAAAPAISCMTTPYEIWRTIDAALPKVKLSEAGLARVKELRTKAFAAQRVAGKYDEAVIATHEAMRIVGLVRVTPKGEGGRRPPHCGGTYRLK